MRGAIDRAYEIAGKLPVAFVPQQFENPANPRYHQETTAYELWEQTGGRADAIVMGAGTGGTFTGVVRHFRAAGATLRAVLVEPQGSVWGGGQPGPHRVEGIGGSYCGNGNLYLGLEAAVGLAWRFASVPIDLTLEAVPRLGLFDAFGAGLWFDVGAAFHARYYF